MLIVIMQVKKLLCPKNDTANLINDYVIHQLPGEGITLLTAYSVQDSVANDFQMSF